MSYRNGSEQIQVVRIENTPDWKFERIVFPGDRILFETVLEATLQVHSQSPLGTPHLTHIPCFALRVLRLFELFEQHGGEVTKGYSLSQEELNQTVLGSSFTWYSCDPVGRELDGFAAAGIETIEDIRDRWVNSFFFGSESDDCTFNRFLTL